MSSAPTINITISAQVEPLLRLREPFTGDQEQMLVDMRQIAPLRRDPFDRLMRIYTENVRRAFTTHQSRGRRFL
ncbi:hypothetical protein [Mesorhizobium sp. B2-1-2]|uniref:hypothetical protein n=1 Tax=Mesorhizobium sp. B2-1-2 TaxID=2589973 RepID=UPI00112DFCF8|nr:hypothetical protein [Mesorhizobium sp. B2-1-2]TPN04518.1 hypothetical protein FJ971_29680 [Mesorhizobium sp. B2-1-2]